MDNKLFRKVEVNKLTTQQARLLALTYALSFLVTFIAEAIIGMKQAGWF